MLVGELIERTQGPSDSGRIKLFDWLLWCFPWLNAHHKNTLTGEPKK